MRQTVVLKLQDALAAVAVEWTADSASGWQACASLGEGGERLPIDGEDRAHVLARGGRIDGIALCHRLVPGGPWSPASQDRKA